MKYSIANKSIISALCCILLLVSVAGRSQQIMIKNTKELLLNRLKPASRTFQVYFKIGENARPSRFQVWKRTVKDTICQQQPAVLMTHQVLINDTVVDWSRTIFNRESLSSMYHETWSKPRGSERFDFINGTLHINNRLVTASDTAQRQKQAFEGFVKARSMYSLNWHADLELFPLFPFHDSSVITVPFYHPGSSGPVLADYRVNGSAIYEDENGKLTDCWLVKYENRSIMMFWIAKKTGEVMKLEEQFGKNMYRFKIQVTV
jgi:hypothetical protein